MVTSGKKHHIRKKDIDKLLDNYSIEEIESSTVELFLEENEISDFDNLFIKKIIKQSNKTSLIKTRLKKFGDVDLKFIERVFELLIPKDDRELNGAFYTPSFIVEYIINKTIHGDDNVCDPSCGSGAFLVEATRKIHKITGKSIIETIENNIYGCDILDYSIKRTKILLSLLALENKEDKEVIKFNIISGDSLLLDWNEKFPNLNDPNEWESFFKINPKKSGFDAIIGNPPYLRIQDLSDQVKENLIEKWSTISKGSFNIYFAFFQLGIELLKSDGLLGYIVPNNFFTSLSAKNLRIWMQDKIEEIVDFNHLQIFQDVTTYTCITILRNSNKKYFDYRLIEKENDLKSLYNLNFTEININELNPKKWRLLNAEDFINIKKIENIGTPLGKLTKIKASIATLKDKLYFVDGSNSKDNYYLKTYKGDIYPIEKDITRDIIKISNVKTENDIKNNELKMIFPYRQTNDKTEIIPENELETEFPKCYSYLLAVRDELATRDKGKKTYETWYAYGRRQGIENYGARILTPTFSKKPRFLIDWKEDSFFSNGYGIFYNENDYDLEILRNILNSIVMDYYITKTSVHLEGGFPCFQKNFIELFSIPKLTEEEKEIIKFGKKDEIDEFLVKKYNLTQLKI